MLPPTDNFLRMAQCLWSPCKTKTFEHVLNAVGLLNHMGKCIFNENWLQKDRYKHWLRCDSNNHKARCRLCSKSFNIGNMGESALVSHLKGIKHRQLEKSQTVLEKDFSSPGKVLEKSLNFILENLYEP